MGLKRLIREARVGSHALWLALQDARTPRVARVLALVVLAYALSPIDLIPDLRPLQVLSAPVRPGHLGEPSARTASQP